MTLGTALKLAPYAAVIALLLFLGVTRSQLSDTQAEVRGHRACVAAVAGVPAKGSKVVVGADATCGPAIAAADRLARQQRACEAALGSNVTTTKGDLISATGGTDIAARCPAQVARLFRQSLSDAATILGLRGAIDAAKVDRDQAVTRAEIRARQLAEREHRAQAARESAPRDSDGLRVYDADRLRERWEVAP